MTDALIIEEPDRAGIARVRTTALLPSGAVLSLSRRAQGTGLYLLSDDSAGAEDVRALGHVDLTSNDTKRGRDIAEQFGLEFSAGNFQVRDVAEEETYAATIHLAEATRRWSTEVIEAAARRDRADLVEVVADRVSRVFRTAILERGRELTGSSGKRHAFDLVADIGRDRLILFETVAPFAAALSAAHLKLFDLKEAHPEWPREVVTERLSAWDPADMVLLAGVSTHVREASRAQWNDLADLVA